ncbi:cupin domain-containing protein [Candidatus Saccharibacteria bacterium]|nr:cupin domain-containing protein [Candidatus Saccharibacteria bacterium]
MQSEDFGGEPYVVNIEDLTLANDDYRQAKWTGAHMQITLMSIPVGGEIGLEVHTDHDQFLRIEAGSAKAFMGPSKDNLDFVKEAGPDFAIFVPAGTWHNLVNVGDAPLKLYSIYAPGEHPRGTLHHTYEEAMAAEHAE